MKWSRRGGLGKNTKKREPSFLHRLLEGIGSGSASSGPKPERERLRIDRQFARDRAVMKCVVRAYKAWEYKSECSVGSISVFCKAASLGFRLSGITDLSLVRGTGWVGLHTLFS